MSHSRAFLRNFIFGAEDSLVSTVGLLSGISFAGLGSRAIIASGIILILVEALSMAAGVYVSEDSSNDMATSNGQKDNQALDAWIMFFSYLVMGLIPLLPYPMLNDPQKAFPYSIGLSILTLFIVGIYKGFYVKKNVLKSGLKLALIGTIVIVLAVIVGSLIKI